MVTEIFKRHALPSMAWSAPNGTCAKAKAALTAAAAAASALPMTVMASELDSQIDSTYNRMLDTLEGPLFRLGIIAVFLGIVGMLFLTDKKKEVARGILIGGIVAVILFAGNAQFFRAIVDAITQIGGSGTSTTDTVTTN